MAGVLVHEWISQSGGSENVLQAMSEVYPDADIVCLWNDSVGRFPQERLRESWLARSPLRRSKAVALPFMPATWRKQKNLGYDWALISSHLFAHHVRFNPQPGDFRRFVYVHTPARYIWAPELDGRGQGRTARTIAAALRPLDRQRARQIATYAANSDFVRRRMAAAWGVEARVIYPPVEVDRDPAGRRLERAAERPRVGHPGRAAGRLPARRLALRALQAAGPGDRGGRGSRTVRSSWPVAGRSSAALRAAARDAPEFRCTSSTAPSTALLRALYQRAAVFVFPAVEDFGIMPVEAMAAGAPGARPGGRRYRRERRARVDRCAEHFLLAAPRCKEAVAAALATRRADRCRHAELFRAERFRAEIRAWVGAS